MGLKVPLVAVVVVTLLGKCGKDLHLGVFLVIVGFFVPCQFLSGEERRWHS